MQVLIHRNGGPLKANQRGELARLIVLVGGLDMFLPDRFNDVRLIEIRIGEIRGKTDSDLRKGVVHFLGVAALDLLDDRVVFQLFGQVRFRVGQLWKDAQILGMISHCNPVVGDFLLYHLP